MSYLILHVNETTVQLTPEGENRPFLYEIRNIRSATGGNISMSDLVIGDFLWADQSNYLHLPEFSSKRICETRAYLKDPNVPAYFLEEFRYIRVMDRKNFADLNFIISIKILEFTYISRDSVHIEKIRGVCPQLAQICNFFLNNIKLGNFNLAMTEALKYPDHILSLFIHLAENYNKNYERIFDLFGFKIRIFNNNGNIETLYNMNGSIDINLLKVKDGFHILYTEHEKASMDYIEYYNFTKAYIGIEKNPSKIQNLRKEIDKLDKDFNLLKQLTEHIIIDLKKQKLIKPLIDLRYHLAENGIDQSYFEDLTCSNCSQFDNLITLKCNHKYCEYCFEEIVRIKTQGLMVLNDFEKQFKLSCDHCSYEITIEDLEKHLKGFHKYNEDATKRAVLKCQSCGIVKNRNMFYSKCLHSCYECQADNIRENIKKCNDCNHVTTNQEVQKFLQVDFKCDSCFENYKLIKEFGKKLCDHHFCLNCYDDESLRTNQVCFIDDKSFNISRAEYKMLFQVKCSNCPDLIDVRSKFWRLKNCQCPICDICLLNDKNYIEDKTKCPVCSTKFNENAFKYIETMYQDKQDRDKITKACPVCCIERPMDVTIDFLNCGHIICKSCFSSTISEFFKDISQINSVKMCPVCMEVEIAANQLDILLTPEQSEKLNIISAQTSGGQIMACPKCNERFELSMVRKAVCVNKDCNYSFCKQCNEPFHESGDCEDIFIQQRIEMLKEDPGGVTQCPKCRWPYIKNTDTCAHASCINPVCGIDFCFTCACVRSPTMEHGNHYHRPECSYFSDYDGRDDKPSEKCSECKIQGGLCKRPKRLQTPRLVTREEVSK